MVEREQGGQLDAFNAYFQEVRDIPLLTPEEESELLRQRNKGRRAKVELKVLENNGLNPEEKEQLEFSIVQGEEALERLVGSNQRLVMKIAKNYLYQGVPFMDLIQEGSIGLIKAIDRFDPRKTKKLSTYATWWIRQAVGRAVANQAWTIRRPIHIGNSLREVSKIRNVLEAELGREPTVEEIAERLKQKPAKIKKLLGQIALPPLSLDENIGEEEETARGEMIEDKEAPSPLKESERTASLEGLQKQFKNLTSREREVIELRFGLVDGDPRTLSEVAEEFKLSRERIRQIEAEALRKLRHPSRTRRLRDYLKEG